MLACKSYIFSATGVDISDEAIAFARKLSVDSSIPATFLRAEVLSWLAQTTASDERFDIVYCSYGAVHWIADLDAWAKGIVQAQGD